MPAWSTLPSSGTPAEVAYLLALIVLCVAALTDLARRTIPNSLTYGAMVAGLFLGAMTGWSGLGVSLVGLLGVGSLLAILFHCGALGGGDVKLAAALGALLGFAPATETVLAGAVMTGLLLVLVWIQAAIIVLVRRLSVRDLKFANGVLAQWTLLARSGQLVLAPLHWLSRLGSKRVPFAPGLALAFGLGCACKWGLAHDACFLGLLSLRL